MADVWKFHLGDNIIRFQHCSLLDVGHHVYKQNQVKKLHSFGNFWIVWVKSFSKFQGQDLWCTFSFAEKLMKIFKATNKYHVSRQIAPKIKSRYATFLREFQHVKIIKQSQMGVSVIALKNWTLCQVQCNLDSVSIGRPKVSLNRKCTLLVWVIMSTKQNRVVFAKWLFS